MAAGCELAVRVIPRASNAGIAGMRADAVLVRLGAAPVEGAANAELVGLVARRFDCPRRAVTIKSGGAGRLKLVRIEH